jgi:hypothetical protein
MTTARHNAASSTKSGSAPNSPSPPRPSPPPWPPASEANLLTVALTAWARVCPRPLVLFFDEIDALHGQA